MYVVSPKATTKKTTQKHIVKRSLKELKGFTRKYSLNVKGRSKGRREEQGKHALCRKQKVK